MERELGSSRLQIPSGPHEGAWGTVREVAGEQIIVELDSGERVALALALLPEPESTPPRVNGS